MFAGVLKEHEEKQSSLRSEAELKRRDVASKVGAISEGLVDSVNEHVSCMFLAQREIEKTAKSVQNECRRFAKQTSEWLELIEGFSSGLKELGDVQTWTKSVESGMRDVSRLILELEKLQSEEVS